MRVGLIAPPWVPVPPVAYGGTEAVVDNLARGLAAAGHDVRLFTTGDATCPVDRRWVWERAQGQRIGDTAVELRHVVNAYDALRDCDIVHDHTLAGPVYGQRFASLPVVTTNHGPFNTDLRDLYRAIGARVPIIAISHAQAASAPDVPIARVIHHGIEPAAFPVGRGDGGYLLFLGRMADVKGADTAARVARQAGLPLILAAKMREPAERRFFAENVQPLLSDDIVFVGEVDFQRKLELLGGAMALVNPIRWPEPFGLVMIEALACGTPVLAFPCGAAAEIITHGTTGFLCSGEDEMVSQVGHVESLDRHACRASVETHFSTRRMVADHLQLYTDVVAGALAAQLDAELATMEEA